MAEWATWLAALGGLSAIALLVQQVRRWWRGGPPNIEVSVVPHGNVHHLLLVNTGRDSAFHVQVHVVMTVRGHPLDPVTNTSRRELPIRELPGGEFFPVILHLREEASRQLVVTVSWRAGVRGVTTESTYRPSYAWR